MDVRGSLLSRSARSLSVCAAIALLSLFTWPAQADDLKRAESHFRRAVKLYEERAYEEALVEFERAYEISPQYPVLFNIAQVHYQLNEYAEAMRAFRRYLKEGGRDIPEERRRYVRRELRELRERVGTLEVTTSVPGARVLVDEKEVGVTPLEPITVDIGRHVVRVELEGHWPVTRRVELSSGAKAQLDLTLTPLAVPEPPPSEELTTISPAPAPLARRTRALWALGSASVALAVGASTSFAVAFAGNRDLDAELERLPPDGRSVQDKRDQVRRAALASDILGACTVAAVAGFIVTLVRGPRADTDADISTARMGTRLHVSLTGLSVRGMF